MDDKWWNSDTYNKMFIDKIISVLDRLDMPVQSYFSSLEHLLLQVKISNVLGTLLVGKSKSLLLLFLNLFSNGLKLHLTILLLNLLLHLRANNISLVVIFKSLNSFNLCLILHDFLFSFFYIRFCLVFQCKISSG